MCRLVVVNSIFVLPSDPNRLTHVSTRRYPGSIHLRFQTWMCRLITCMSRLFAAHCIGALILGPNRSTHESTLRYLESTHLHFNRSTHFSSFQLHNQSIWSSLLPLSLSFPHTNPKISSQTTFKWLHQEPLEKELQGDPLLTLGLHNLARIFW